ncbi:MAG: hypothetical protein HN936_13620 [Bacteroidetes bacterium]|jgi:hypothetical protein|nr:hypothetical protein [Candidatus Neomarinimicrobiota bacterium]MBT6357217.1 hypothetical protein [Chloroflexota bacterium]MBT7094279.1 hypothetical protein [Bacteroidota bacterium]MBT4361294.1 hypothetical protein [Candidatus Neomarinimicrobiota bacterium]MBT4944765.1 hypothetical protein [Candidatus Neomarinimicrobiota bacterium]
MSWKKIFNKSKERKSEAQNDSDQIKPATNATDALKNIVSSLEEMDEYLDDNPEIEAELIERLKNEGPGRMKKKNYGKKNKPELVKPPRKKSLKKRLKELKELYDDELISEQEYDEKRQDLIKNV